MRNRGTGDSTSRTSQDATPPRRNTRRLPSISFVLLTLAVIAAGSGVVAWAFIRTEPREIEIIIPTPGPVVVQVTGLVSEPGVYSLPPGSRVQDAINAAGGLTASSRINLAAELRDGQQLVVREEPEGQNAAGADDESGSAEDDPNVLLDLNTASASQLDQLPGIGPSRAAAIVEFRERNGPILFVDDLTAIDGIGPATVDRLRNLVVQP